MGFIRKYILNFFWYLIYPITKLFLPKFKILNSVDTLRLIRENSLSFIRYGDGEFDIMKLEQGPAFQRYSSELCEDLLITLKTRELKLLICIPEVFSMDPVSFVGMKRSSVRYWKTYVSKNMFFLKSILDDKYQYGNSLVSRPFISSCDRKSCEIIFDQFKKIVEGEVIVLIEGDKTRFGIGNDLLDGAKQVRRIIAPATNAYSKRKDIINFAMTLPQSYVFILALGPAAKAIGRKLFLLGYRVLDLGHLDVEYEWYRCNAQEKISIPNKFVNESKEKYVSRVSDIKQDYLDQILFDCSH